MIGRDCRCPGCGTCGAASEVERLRERLAVERTRNGAGKWNAERVLREKAERERDELRAQLAFMRDEYGINADNGTLTRDALEQKIQVLLHERRQLRARLVECRPWVGVLPYPNTPKFSEMIAIRDLADDTLEEVQP